MPNTFKPDFLLIPINVILDKRLQPLDLIVYWAIYFLSTLKNWECTASNATIAKMIGAWNSRSVSHSMSRLESSWFIKRNLDVVNWETKRLSVSPTVTFVNGVVSDDTTGGINWWGGVVSNDTQNKNNINNNNILQIPLPEENRATRAAAYSKNEDIKKLLSKWNSYNPAIWYSNITQRKAVEAMLEAMTLQEAEELIETAISVQWQPFAPVITTPFELRAKIIKLRNFIDRYEVKRT